MITTYCYANNILTTGNTPLVRLNNIGNGLILAKIESKNPNFSVKCRIGLNIIKNAEQQGLIKYDTELIEITSGNTGIALASIAAYKKYKLTLIMPDNMSYERHVILKALGANLILSEGNKGILGSFSMAEKIISSYKSNKKNFLLLKQFSNPANPEIHEKTTGPEIWKDTNGQIDVLVSGVGTGGTITGITKYIKQYCKKPIYTVAVEPKNSPVISQTLLGKKVIPGPHYIQGIGAGFIPKNLDLNLIDRVETITNEEAINGTKEIIKKEGILAGISSGAALIAALKIQKENKFNKKNIVVIFPSATERDINTHLFNK